MDTPLTPATLHALRQTAVATGDCDISRLCSAALWGTAAQAKAARRKLNKLAKAGAL